MAGVEASELSVRELSEKYYRAGVTDGLPIVVPTDDDIERFVQACGRDRSHVFCVLPPAHGAITVEKLAINATMAGCLPEYAPVIVAALEAMVDPEFCLNSIQTTTGSAAPLVIVNGPVRHRLDINGAAGALGPGWRANATIGRAIRLLLMNVGGAKPGKLDMAIVGQPGKYTFCMGEHEEQNPWEPLHVERGYLPAENTVTVFAASGTMEVVDLISGSAMGVLTTIAHSLGIVGSVTEHTVLCGGYPLIILCPEHAATIARDGWKKADARKFLFEQAQFPLAWFSAENAAAIRQSRRRAGRDEEAPVGIAERPEDISIVVAGGVGAKSTIVPVWGAGSRPVTRRVESLEQGVGRRGP